MKIFNEKAENQKQFFNILYQVWKIGRKVHAIRFIDGKFSLRVVDRLSKN